jgi:hypothetical protein
VAQRIEPVMTCVMCKLEGVAPTTSLTLACTSKTVRTPQQQKQQLQMADWLTTDINHSADSRQEWLHQEVGAVADNTCVLNWNAQIKL